MKESFGSVFLYNVIILFIIITFSFLAGTLSYMKAFKVNSRIINAIEKYEGYNMASAVEIESILSTLGYKQESPTCGVRNNAEAMPQIGVNTYLYCVYHHDYDSDPTLKQKDYYGVVTYMYFDFPIVGNVRIPLYSKTEKIYRFKV